MNRVDFMSQLERLLQNIAASEREEAIQYYNDYFDDAGKENEQAVIEALGSPARVAENIKKDLLDAAGGEEAAGKVKASDRVLMEYGKGDRNRENGREAGDDRKAEDGRNTGDGQGARYGRESGPWGSYVQGSDSDGGDFRGGYSHRQPAYAQPVKDDRTPAWLIALAATVLILLSPAILGVVLSVLGVLGGGLAAWFVMILGFGVAALGLFIAFVVQMAGVTIPAIATVSIRNKMPILPHSNPPPIRAAPTHGLAKKQITPVITNITSRRSRTNAVTPKPNIRANHVTTAPSSVPATAITAPNRAGAAKIRIVATRAISHTGVSPPFDGFSGAVPEWPEKPCPCTCAGLSAAICCPMFCSRSALCAPNRGSSSLCGLSSASCPRLSYSIMTRSEAFTFRAALSAQTLSNKSRFMFSATLAGFPRASITACSFSLPASSK